MPGGFLPPVVAEIVGEMGKFSAAMGKTKAQMSGLEAANAKLAAAGKVAMAGLAVGVAAVGYESVKLAMGFDQTMELIHTQAGAAQSEVDGLKSSVLKLAPAVGIGPEKLAEGLYHIESTGFRGKEAMDILAASARLASIGMADLDTVTYAMSGVMSVAMKDVHSAADATNYLNTIVGMGDMRMDKLAAAIGTGILPSMKSAGLGMMDFGAALATLTDNSVPADEAATRLRMTVALMAAPSGKAASALESIGLKSTALADDMRKPNGLLVAVQDLKRHLEHAGLTASQQNEVIEHAFGGGRTSGAILTLLEESDRLASKYKQLGTEASRAKQAHEAWAKQQEQFSQKWHNLTAALQVVGVKIGNWLIPKIEKLVTWLSKHTGVVKTAAVIIGSVLVAAIGAWTYAVIANTVAMLANPVTWIIIGIVALIAALYLLVTHWHTVWEWLKKAGVAAWHFIYDWIVHPIVKAFEWMWHGIHKGLSWLSDRWGELWHGIGTALSWVYDHTLKPIIDGLTGAIDLIQKGIDKVTGHSSDVVSFKQIKHYATGGTVPGPVGAPQLAVVHGGEEVLSVEQIRAMGRRSTSTPSSGGAGDGGDIVIHIHQHDETGKQTVEKVLRYARRRNIAPINLFPATVNAR